MNIWYQKRFAFILGRFRVAIGPISFEVIIAQYTDDHVPQTYLCEKAKG